MAASGEKLHLPESAISQEASNITIAGTDTAAIALTYLVWAVLKRLAVRQKLHAELADPNLPPDPTGKDLETLPYLNSVIEETLRLYTPISRSLPRTVPAAGATLSGYALPPGATVSTPAYTFHCDHSVYADALAFSPDRWLHPTKEMKNAFFAWGAGSRGCLGTHIARLELMHATYMFFRMCGDARIVEETTTEQSIWPMLISLSSRRMGASVRLRLDRWDGWGYGVRNAVVDDRVEEQMGKNAMR
jgi:cytochrome P450